MRVKLLGALLLSVFLIPNAFSWGQLGHRVVGEVAEIYLSKKAKKRIAEVLDRESLAVSSTWMDEIKSDDAYDHTHDWHWVTIPDGKTYAETEKNPNGDVIATIERIIKELKVGGLSHEKEAEHVKMLVHLIGDIHQPLHVGTGEDKGGNDVRLKWFWSNSNLHRVWDSEMINDKQYSYTELTEAVNITTKEQVEKWQNDSVMDWAKESVSLRSQVYDLPEDKELSYEYAYKNWDTVQIQLLKAGIRLAGVLNDIYG